MPKTISKSDAIKLQKQVDDKKGSSLCFKGTCATIYPPCSANPKPSEKDGLKGLKTIKAKPKPKGLSYIENALKVNDIAFATEFQFDKKRKYRADIHFHRITQFGVQSIIIEYEGLVSSKSRHTTLTGYTKDCDKYNLATSLGYKVYRYTALNYKNIHELIKELV